MRVLANGPQNFRIDSGWVPTAPSPRRHLRFDRASRDQRRASEPRPVASNAADPKAVHWESALHFSEPPRWGEINHSNPPLKPLDIRHDTLSKEGSSPSRRKCFFGDHRGAASRFYRREDDSPPNCVIKAVSLHPSAHLFSLKIGNDFRSRSAWRSRPQLTTHVISQICLGELHPVFHYFRNENSLQNNTLNIYRSYRTTRS